MNERAAAHRCLPQSPPTMQRPFHCGCFPVNDSSGAEHAPSHQDLPRVARGTGTAGPPAGSQQ
eukprot:1811951-Rhodomonas_salina.1